MPWRSASNLARMTLGPTSGRQVAWEEKPQSARAMTRSLPAIAV